MHQMGLGIIFLVRFLILANAFLHNSANQFLTFASFKMFQYLKEQIK